MRIYKAGVVYNTINKAPYLVYDPGGNSWASILAIPCKDYTDYGKLKWVNHGLTFNKRGSDYETL